MENLTRLTGLVAPFRQDNIDTDRIIPSSELVRAQTEGHAASLFAGERYLENRVPDPAFLLNRSPFDRAQILVAGENFGSGSSREDAPKALRAFGFRVIIAKSFGGIFFNNCFLNGLLPIELPFDMVLTSSDEADARTTVELKVDLEAQTVVRPDGVTLAFTTPTIARQMLLEGKDDIALTLSDLNLIEAHWTVDRAARPWIDLSARV